MSIRWTEERAARLLQRPGPGDDKYRRGVLGVRTGSAPYPGAAVLGVSAAWRTGIGLLRYVPGLPSAADDGPGDGSTSAGAQGLPSPAAAVLAARPETVFGDGRCDAWLIGSGTDPAARSRAERAALLELLRGDAPVVVDAGALGLVPEIDAGRAPLILTPHAGEFSRIRSAVDGDDHGAGEDRAPEDPDLAVARLASRLDATILLKGSLTRCSAPGGEVIHSGPATPWLATAGTGDVLAGLLGALAAQHASEVRANPALLAELGATAAVLHDTAARIAADDPDGSGEGHPITALDVADAIPEAFARIAG